MGFTSNDESRSMLLKIKRFAATNAANINNERDTFG